MKPGRPKLPFRAWHVPLVVIVFGIGVVFYSQHHALLPGLRGCAMLRLDSDRTSCLRSRFEKLADRTSSASALNSMDTAARKSMRVLSSCHLALHPAGERLGRRAQERGKPFPDVSTKTLCRQGLMHGAIIGYYAQGKSTDGIADVASTACGAEQKRRGRLECIHAFGHIAARLAESADGAVAACTEIEEKGAHPASDDAQVKHQCQAGVFMEYALEDANKEWDGADDNCKGVAESGSEECYLYLPVRNILLGGNASSARRQCANVRVTEDRVACIRGLVHSVRNDVDCRDFTRSSDRRNCTRFQRDPDAGFLKTAT